MLKSAGVLPFVAVLRADGVNISKAIITVNSQRYIFIALAIFMLIPKGIYFCPDEKNPAEAG